MAVSQSRISQRQRRTAQQPTPSSVDVLAVRTHLVPFYWPFVEKYISEACKYSNGELEPQDIEQLLLAQRMYLFVTAPMCGAVVCETVQYPRKSTIRIVLLAGEHFPVWRDKLDAQLSDWGRRIGASGIEALVRPGFQPQLEAYGAKVVQLKMWRSIDG